MFGIPIDEIDYSTLINFLETGVREGFAIDFKREFPSHLEKTLAAFANTYGGIVLIGVDETSTGAAQLPVKGVELRSGLRERVLQIGLDAVYPPVLPEVRVVEFKSDANALEADRAVIVVRVNESENAPHAIENRTVVYLRADNISTRFERKATIGELEWLLNKRQRSLEEKSRMLDRATHRAEELRPRRRSRRTSETYRRDGSMRLWTIPVFPRWPLAESREWARIVKSTRVPVPLAAPELPQGDVQRVSGGLLYDGEYGYSEFQQQGLIFHEFDYWWDFSGPATSPGARQLLPGVTAALLWGTLELSQLIYRQVGYSGLVELRFEADGLKGAFFAEAGAVFSGRTAKLIESQVALEKHFTAGELEDRLIAIARECQSELYWAFGIDATESLLSRDFLDFQ